MTRMPDSEMLANERRDHRNQKVREAALRFKNLPRDYPDLAEVFTQYAAAHVAAMKAVLGNDVDKEEEEASARGETRKLIEHNAQDLIAEAARLSQVLNAKMRSLGLPPNYLQPRWDCPKCQDTGWIGREKCECEKARERERLFAASRMPEEAREHRFAKGGWPKDAAKVVAFARDFSAGKDPGVGFYLAGNVGAGKTYLFDCIVNVLIENMKSVLYLRDIDFFNELRITGDGAREDRLEMVKEVDYLLIDNLGAARPTSWVRETMFNVLDYRYRHHKATAFTSNMKLYDLAMFLATPSDKPEAGYRDSLGEAIASRISQMCQVMTMPGGDRRMK